MRDCLVVDDSRTIRIALTRMMGTIGFECSEAEDGAMALRACTEKMPSVILLDWNMPGMTGLECLQHLRAMPNGAEPKILLCTTESETDRIVAALSSGADEYIIKLFDAEILRLKLEEAGVI